MSRDGNRSNNRSNGNSGPRRRPPIPPQDDTRQMPVVEAEASSPQAETPAPETPAAETPAAETPAAETPAPESPAAETPAAETAAPRAAGPKAQRESAEQAEAAPRDKTEANPPRPSGPSPAKPPEGGGPTADESLSVEMAAGGVQQPPQQRRSRQRGVRAALATIPVAEPGASFWVDLEGALADQQPLAIAARPAIRPITEPPPLSQPKLSDYLESTKASNDGDFVRRTREGVSGDLAGRSSRSSRSAKAPDFGLGGSSGRGRKALAAVVLVVLGLLIAGTIMGDSDDKPSTSTDAGAGGGAADDHVTTTAPPPDAAPTTAPAVPGLEPEARLTPLGIGPLHMGMTLGDINAAGVTANVDQPTFDASSGICFDARPAAAADLTLRFHGPQPGAGVEDPNQGVLGAITIRDVDGSVRTSEADIGLKSTEEQVQGAHAGALEVSDNPARPGGHVYLARSADNPDYGIAYATDGAIVTDISVGEVQMIGSSQACP